MTGRSLHDTLLRVLSHGPLRAQLLDKGDGATAFSSDERRILRGVSNEPLRNMARFLARHYYGERIVRLFRHVRGLAGQTGRDPLLVLSAPQARSVIEDAVLGSPQTADSIVALIESFLLQNDSEVQMRFPYWRDLVRYQATMFRIEARRAKGHAARLPCRSASAQIVEFEWNLPVILAHLQSSSAAESDGAHCPSILLIASSADRQVTSLRCTSNVQRLFEAADGTRTVEQLAKVAALTGQETKHVLRKMRDIGAVQWQASVTTHN